MRASKCVGRLWRAPRARRVAVLREARPRPCAAAAPANNQQSWPTPLTSPPAPRSCPSLHCTQRHNSRPQQRPAPRTAAVAPRALPRLPRPSQQRRGAALAARAAARVAPVPEVAALLDAFPYLDVRTAEEFAAGHVKGAVNGALLAACCFAAAALPRFACACLLPPCPALPCLFSTTAHPLRDHNPPQRAKTQPPRAVPFLIPGDGGLQPNPAFMAQVKAAFPEAGGGVIVVSNRRSVCMRVRMRAFVKERERPLAACWSALACGIRCCCWEQQGAEPSFEWSPRTEETSPSTRHTRRAARAAAARPTPPPCWRTISRTSSTSAAALTRGWRPDCPSRSCERGKLRGSCSEEAAARLQSRGLRGAPLPSRCCQSVCIYLYLLRAEGFETMPRASAAPSSILIPQIPAVGVAKTANASSFPTLL